MPFPPQPACPDATSGLTRTYHPQARLSRSSLLRTWDQDWYKSSRAPNSIPRFRSFSAVRAAAVRFTGVTSDSDGAALGVSNDFNRYARAPCAVCMGNWLVPLCETGPALAFLSASRSIPHSAGSLCLVDSSSPTRVPCVDLSSFTVPCSITSFLTSSGADFSSQS